MGLLDKLKDLFKDDNSLAEDPQGMEETPTNEEGSADSEEKSQSLVLEDSQDTAAPHMEVVSPTKIEPRRKREKVENYVENANEALKLISRHLSRYSGSADSNLEVLTLWVVIPDSDSQVGWADTTFLRELKARLHQERIDAVKEIKIKSVPHEEVEDLLESDSKIYPIVEERLYYRTRSKDEGPAPDAWLICIAGQEHTENETYALDNNERKIWNIGRGKRPDVMEVNEIAIKDSCRSVSRRHAAIVASGGRYYLQCKEGGCRVRGGSVTKIIRADGLQQELVSLDYDGLPPLEEGDTFQLSKAVYFRFTYMKPKGRSGKSRSKKIDSK